MPRPTANDPRSLRRHPRAQGAPIAPEPATIRAVSEIATHRASRTGAVREQSRSEINGSDYAAFFENSPHDLFVLDVGPDGRFVFDHVNPMVTRSTGYTYEMLVGKTPEEALTPANSARLTAKYRECVETRQRVEYDVAGQAPIGEVVRHTVLVPITDQAGIVRKILGTSTDVTALRRAEAQLQARAQELAELNDQLRRERLLAELIVENTTEGIIVIDTQFRHLLWNAGMERINGLTRDAVLGRSVFELFPDLKDHPVGQAWRDAVAGRRTELRDRHYFSPVRGAETVYDADFAPLYDQKGLIIGAIGIVRDTTEHHRIEQMLRQSQKLEAVAQLTGGVAHDFNNLLTAVIGCLEVISQEATTERIARFAGTALRAADRGTQLTQQLLAFARRQALRPGVVDLNQLLDQIEMLLRRAVGAAVEIIIDRAPDAWHGEVDPAQFEAAAINLVLNARDAMPSGGRVKLTTRNAQIRDVPPDFDLSPGEYVAFAVEDTGHGMTPEVAARAFEPFYTTKEIGKGSGLGLSMVYGFAKQSGGGVQLQTQPGTGTRVTVYLPRAPTPIEPAHQAAPADQVRHGSGSILIVEDDEDVRQFSVVILQERGYRVKVARDGREALNILRDADDIDLLFTDIVMPGGVSGVVLAREAKRICPRLKVLLTTGYAELQATGMQEFAVIRKPFRPAELTRLIDETMDSGTLESRLPKPVASPPRLGG